MSNQKTDRVSAIKAWANQSSRTRKFWHRRNQYFHKLDTDYLRFLIPANQKVLALGCGSGAKLAAIAPALGIGVDLSEEKIAIAKELHPHLNFIVGDMEDPKVVETLRDYGPFDTILLYDSLGFAWDIQKFLRQLVPLCSADTRVVSVYYAYSWEPILKILEICSLRMRSFDTTWLRMEDVERFLESSGFRTVKKEWRILCPAHLLGVGRVVNKVFGSLPLVRKLSLRHYVVARPAIQDSVREEKTVTVVIPCRNEKGNIKDAVQRIPRMGKSTELIFVEGHSQDGTWQEIQKIVAEYPELDIKSIRQSGVGKGNAVRDGFALATGEVLMILDADLTVAPEDLPKFYNEFISGRGEYINGSRLVYSMEDDAMRFLNYLANHMFASIFSFLLNQTFTDTLCGTKVISQRNYIRLLEGREYFGDFDPFGDFDLIFGAIKLNLEVAEVPIRYGRRQYGTTQISRFRHGLMLLRMVVFAFRKLKLV